MIATTSHTKTCSNCWARKSIDEYRFVSREKGTRRSHCRDCRRTIEQTQKTKKSRRVFVNGLREIRRSSTTKRIHNLIEGLAAEVGGISVVFEMFTALLMSGTPRDRLRGTSTLMFVAAMIDLNRIESMPEPDAPETVVRELHRTQQLAPILRQLYADGSISRDDIDSPPT